MPLRPALSRLAVLLCLGACATVPVTGRRQLVLIPNSMIHALSFTQYDSVVKTSRTLPVTEPRAAMVARVGTGIQGAVERYMAGAGIQKELAGYQWAYNTIDENIVNAWCMPGGKVVVYTGLLPITQNERALAVVMGHEIAHAIARHGSERMSQALLVGLGGLALDQALKEKSNETRLLFLGLYTVGSKVALELPHSRMQESEADKLGLIFMAMAGYDPTEAVPFWQRMSAANKGGPSVPGFLSTHPSDEQRIRALSALIPEVRAKYYAPAARGT